MKKIIHFYIKAYLIICLISLPFIFIAFEDVKAKTFSYAMWVAAFFPQLIYVVYLFRDRDMYKKFKTNFLCKNFHIGLIVISGLIPFIIYFFFIGFKLIKVYDYGIWTIEILVYFILIFLSASLEEILFRFIPYTLLSKDPTIKEVLLVSLFFSIFHLFNPNANLIGLANVMIAGVFFSLVYLKTNSILLVSFIHAFWNFSIGCILGSSISGIKIISFIKYKPLEPFFLSGGDFGFEGSILTSVAFLVYSVFLYSSNSKQLFKSI